MKFAVCSVVNILLIGQIPYAAAQARLSADTFLQSCAAHESESNQQDESSVCLAFLQGYLSASNDISLESERFSPFMERALGNRVSNRLIADEKLPGRYCLPEDFSFDGMISSIVEQGTQVAGSAPAQEVVERTLEAEFRC